MGLAKFQQVSDELASGVKNVPVELFTLEQQFIRILRCTARGFASSPGGWQVSDATQRWLDDLGKLDQTPRRVIGQGSNGSLSTVSN